MPTDLLSLEVLDARQLSRIEATHRGFLYQHLFAAGCLLKGSSGVDSVVVEHDEDLELVTGREAHLCPGKDAVDDAP